MKNLMLIFLIVFFYQSVYAHEVKTLMLKLEVGDNEYSLVDSWLVNRKFPPTTSPVKTSAGAINWTITSAEGEVLVKGIIADPQIVRAHLADNKNGNELVPKESRKEKTMVFIRVPYNEKMMQLNIERTPTINLPAVTTRLNKPKDVNANPRNFPIRPRNG